MTDLPNPPDDADSVPEWLKPVPLDQSWKPLRARDISELTLSQRDWIADRNHVESWRNISEADWSRPSYRLIAKHSLDGPEAVWGFHVYRTVYTVGSDALWRKALDRIREAVKVDIFDDVTDMSSRIEYFSLQRGIPFNDAENHPDLPDRLDDTPNRWLFERFCLFEHSDPTCFNNADVDTIREYAAEEYFLSLGYEVAEDGRPSETYIDDREPPSPHPLCLMVDEEVLESLTTEDEDKELRPEWRFVKAVDGTFGLKPSNSGYQMPGYYGWFKIYTGMIMRVWPQQYPDQFLRFIIPGREAGIFFYEFGDVELYKPAENTSIPFDDQYWKDIIHTYPGKPPK